MRIRTERECDWEGVYKINASAFESPAEAKLVNALREQAHPLISLVAEEEGDVIGHILFSPVTLDGHTDFKIMGLAPMAVLPDWQGKGIGSALVREGLARCKEMGYAAVVVLGHPAYYPHFGFVPASRFGINSEYDAPDEAFMVLELVPGALSGRSGMARFHKAFEDI